MVESEYEQIRLKRVEENKKRMIELNLNKLSQSLRLSSPSPKPSPVYPNNLSLSFFLFSHFICVLLEFNSFFKNLQAKARTPRTPVDSSEVRRSSRAKNPPPSYKEVLFFSLIQLSYGIRIFYHSSMNEPPR